jgi:hypothetical protein
MMAATSMHNTTVTFQRLARLQDQLHRDIHVEGPTTTNEVIALTALHKLDQAVLDLLNHRESGPIHAPKRFDDPEQERLASILRRLSAERPVPGKESQFLKNHEAEIGPLATLGDVFNVADRRNGHIIARGVCDQVWGPLQKISSRRELIIILQKSYPQRPIGRLYEHITSDRVRVATGLTLTEILDLANAADKQSFAKFVRSTAHDISIERGLGPGGSKQLNSTVVGEALKRVVLSLANDTWGPLSPGWIKSHGLAQQAERPNDIYEYFKSDKFRKEGLGYYSWETLCKTCGLDFNSSHGRSTERAQNRFADWLWGPAKPVHRDFVADLTPNRARILLNTISKTRPTDLLRFFEDPRYERIFEGASVDDLARVLDIDRNLTATHKRLLIADHVWGPEPLGDIIKNIFNFNKHKTTPKSFEDFELITRRTGYTFNYLLDRFGIKRAGSQEDVLRQLNAKIWHSGEQSENQAIENKLIVALKTECPKIMTSSDRARLMRFLTNDAWCIAKTGLNSSGISETLDLNAAVDRFAFIDSIYEED